MTGKKETAVLEVASQDEALGLFGHRDENLKYIEHEMGVSLTFRNGEVTVTGPRATGIVDLMRHILDSYRGGRKVTKSDIKYGLLLLKEDDGGRDMKADLNIKLTDGSGRTIKPRSPRQRDYLEALANHDMVFAIGPAGTGEDVSRGGGGCEAAARRIGEADCGVPPRCGGGRETRLSAGRHAAESGPVSAADLRRAVRNDERGPLRADAGTRDDRGGAAGVHARPHARRRVRDYGRGAEHDDRADEDVSDAARPALARRDNGRHHADRSAAGKTSGLVDAAETLKNLKEIKFIYFSRRDVVRHDLVAKIIKAYEDKDPKTNTEEDDDIAGQED